MRSGVDFRMRHAACRMLGSMGMSSRRWTVGLPECARFQRLSLYWYDIEFGSTVCEADPAEKYLRRQGGGYEGGREADSGLRTA